ncbi:MAG: uracil-DNA glycosylase [Caulobacteraceae bacterium]
MAADERSLESLLAFWREAGVDTALAEAPVDRTARQSEAPPGMERAGPARPAIAEPGVADRAAIEEVVENARRLSLAAPDLASLASAIAAFDGCPLKSQGARQAVFARGASEAPVMVIGEAPGAEEDVRGEPFVGRAGRLLDRMLAAAGLEGRVFITNTVFWRPPGNRAPTLAEQGVCAPFLERATALVRPRLLLLVGAAATSALLRQKTGILSLRGRWFEWRSSDGEIEIPALPTLHPAFLLRTPSAKKMAWKDLLTLSERLDRPARSA